MSKRDPYQIIKSRYITEKATILEGLEKAESNPSTKRCNQPKVVFHVDVNANKQEIRRAVEEIYREEGVKVTDVNTILLKPKAKRVRGRPGKTIRKKKAIVTLRAGDRIGGRN
ncbi:MAG: 50S ribosomal protein L23 [Candidatus Algichlamydia australiensis]|nr:50S ribosomal protein L23 [Chlamydiales bacterium]